MEANFTLKKDVGFPCLKHSGRLGTIVLFASEKLGVAVYCDPAKASINPPYLKVGYICEFWDPAEFELFDGVVTLNN